MKKILIYIVILLAIIGSTAGITLMVKNAGKPKVVVEEKPPTEFPKAIVEETVSKPNVFLGALNKKATPTVTPTPTKIPTSAAEFMDQLKNSYDDGDTVLIDALRKDTAAL